jgi:hypothetical protein
MFPKKVNFERIPNPLAEAAGMEVKGYVGLALTVLGLILFVLVYSIPVAPLLLIPGLVLCRTESNRYKRETGQTAGVLIVAEVACWFFGCLAVLVDLLTIVMLMIPLHSTG